MYSRRKQEIQHEARFAYSPCSSIRFQQQYNQDLPRNKQIGPPLKSYSKATSNSKNNGQGQKATLIRPRPSILIPYQSSKREPLTG